MNWRDLGDFLLCVLAIALPAAVGAALIIAAGALLGAWAVYATGGIAACVCVLGAFRKPR